MNDDMDLVAVVEHQVVAVAVAVVAVVVVAVVVVAAVAVVVAWVHILVSMVVVAVVGDTPALVMVPYSYSVLLTHPASLSLSLLPAVSPHSAFSVAYTCATSPASC